MLYRVRLTMKYQGRINIMTNEMCKEICKNQGYKFSGTEVSIKTYSQDDQEALKMYPLWAVVLYIELELYEPFINGRDRRGRDRM
jgi:hypothetical protein